MALHFGEFELDRERRQLLRSGQPVPLEPKAYELLSLLVERRPRALSRAQIRDVVWPGVFTSESTLGVAVNAIRQALGDDARQPRFIRTVHGFGYAFCGEATGEDAVDEAARPAEPRGPYPGLSSFTEDDADVFFGREAEVEALWERLRRRRLLALIGPSGAGKTSFLRAGVIPARPEGWGAIVSTPGRAPMTGLAQALAPEVAGDQEAVKELLRFEDPDVVAAALQRWRLGYSEALLVVDQFEELFTLNPPEPQTRFADLLGRLSANANVHILLSLRDDFLIRCSEHESLAPVFTADLTPLLALERESLRRALVEPASKEGFAFEDDSLVAEMLDAVEGARGALPLLAFAVSRLWEKRDREKKLLTWAAYEEIGGVAGALAQHAEQTLERIGPEREPVVRELFRNLVTAQWTRASAEREELLSVLPNREVGSQVLDTLIDARLLTSYELRETDRPSRHPERGLEGDRSSRYPERAIDGDRAKDLADDRVEASSALGPGRHRIEIVHESLLRGWPRLVRWQTQDEEGALLRDHLKQAAHLWEEKGRPADLLWTGTSEREFELWRERYPGRLTAVEDDFAQAMVHRARRRKRLRQTVVAGVVGVSLAVAAVVGVSRQQVAAQARRAVAAHLLALAQNRLDDHPTEALAYATASLELADRAEARHVALEALWRGPTEFRFPTAFQLPSEFSPDGRWLVTGLPEGGWALWPSDGGPPTPLEGSTVTKEAAARFSPAGDLVVGHMDTDRRALGLWSVPDGRLLRSVSTGGDISFFSISPGGTRIFTCTVVPRSPRGELHLHIWPASGGEPEPLALLEVPFESVYTFPNVDAAWSRVAWADGRRAHIAPLEGGRLDIGAAATLEHDTAVTGVFFQERGSLFATSSDTAEVIQIWSLERDPPELVRRLSAQAQPGGYAAGLALRFDSSASRLAGTGGVLWDLTAALDAAPLLVQGCWGGHFDPKGQWLATGCTSVSLWPLPGDYPPLLTGHTRGTLRAAFTPDSRWLVSTSSDNTVRLWPLGANGAERSRVLHRVEGAGAQLHALAMAPDGSLVALGNALGQVLVVPLDGGPARELEVLLDAVTAVAVGPRARLVAAGSGAFTREQALVRVWDLATGEVRILDAGDGAQVDWVRFADDGNPVVVSGKKLRRWGLSGEAPRVVEEIDFSHPELEGVVSFKDLAPDGSEMLLSAGGRLWIEDLETRATRDVVRSGAEGGSASFDSTGERIVSRDLRGVVRVGWARGGEPHLLIDRSDVGPTAGLVTVSPDGQRIATEFGDGSIRLWPMPDLSTPPLHTLPRDQLLAKLKSLTNLRAVRDPESSSGWKIEVGPFPGWETVPTW